MPWKQECSKNSSAKPMQRISEQDAVNTTTSRCTRCTGRASSGAQAWVSPAQSRLCECDPMQSTGYINTCEPADSPSGRTKHRRTEQLNIENSAIITARTSVLESGASELLHCLYICDSWIQLKIHWPDGRSLHLSPRTLLPRRQRAIGSFRTHSRIPSHLSGQFSRG